MIRNRRQILRSPSHCNYYLVDANFLVNRYLDPAAIPEPREQERVRKCRAWWAELDPQLAAGCAKIYVPDLCIAEAFKVLAKKYYDGAVFKNRVQYKKARDRLRNDVHLPISQARKQERRILFHDIETTRDVVISVDRFFEKAQKLGVAVGIVDLLLLATAKYLTDFLGFDDRDLFVVTTDGPLYKLARSIRDIPYTFNPLRPLDAPGKVFT